MVKFVESRIDEKELKELANEIGDFYIKVVVDIEKGVLVAGAKMHFEEEKILLEKGSKQQNLWGGGYDLETKQVTFDSIINNRPGINPSSDILDGMVRTKFETIAKSLLGI
jgi:hypothetical protein